jgi:hypothetical protein
MRYLTVLTVFALGCGGASGNGKTGPDDVDKTDPGTVATEVQFENPGGMWMPQQLVEHAELLKSLGLELDPAALSDPLAAPLGAIVSLGGCSASFVSPEGLIITNHHCVQGTLQYHSNDKEDLVTNGFLAMTREEEKWNGPSAKVYVTQKYTDVTSDVLTGLDAIEDDTARYKEIEKREKKLVADCEKDRDDLKCSVRGFFRGAEYHLIEQLKIRDVRLVHAPHRGVGWYGGDEDNWMWPRHTGDYSFYRAYVGKDGQPADYSEDNVPYKPKHHLKIATDLDEGDLIMVAGYPGRTFRHKTAAEVKDSVEWYYPRAISRYEEYIKAFEEVSKVDAETAMRAKLWIFGLGNGLKNNMGMMDGLTKGGLAEQKTKLEADLNAWIAADPDRQAKYGNVFAEMEALDAEYKKTRERDAAFGELGWSSLLRAAGTFVQMAENRPKTDADRDFGFQERNWKDLEAGQKSFAKKYNRNLETTVFRLALHRAVRDVETNRDWLEAVLNAKAGSAITADTVDKFIDGLYAKTKLEGEELRLKLLTASTADLKKSKDPFIQLAFRLRPLEKVMEDRGEAYTGAMTLLKPKYINALREFSDGQIAPDANGTLRVTYGTVRGYKPTADADMYVPFTFLPEMVAKHRGEAPFKVPENVLSAAKAGTFGDYVHPTDGRIPVNYLGDLDTTGGNSGSATLNARGELVGLLFDGNYEAMASDYIFIPELTRSIHVDIRYVLWIMDAADNADHLLEEMGVTPSVN